MKNLKKLFMFLVILGATLALAAGCAKKEGQQAAKEIVIGFNGPLSGPAAEYGRDCANGIEMAINEINEAGGITVGGQRYVFNLVKLDSMANPTQAVNNAQRLRDQFKARVIFDPVFTTIAPQMKINEEKGNEFLLMAYTSTPKVNEMGNKLTISIPPPFTAYLKGYVDYAWQQGWRKVAMIVTTGAYGDEWRQAFREHWEKMGGTITADQPVNYYTQTDFSAQLTAALATKPDALLIGGPSGPTALVIEQARNMGFKGGIMLVDQAKMSYIVDVVFKGKTDLMENVIGVAAVEHYSYPMAKTFAKKYAEKYQLHTVSEVALNYCAMHALAKAMVAAGTVEDVWAIRAAFEKVFPLPGDKFPTEYFGITKTGRMITTATIEVLKGGQYSAPMPGVWWPKTEEEFKRVREKVTSYGIVGPDQVKWVPLKGYAD